MRKFLSCLLIITGFILLTIIFSMFIVNQGESKREVESYIEAVLSEAKESNPGIPEITPTPEPVIFPTEEAIQEAMQEPAQEIIEVKENKSAPLGLLQISKIDLEMLIYEGFDESVLKRNAGHYPNTANIGDIGNCVILGHRSYSYNRRFNRLDELSIGDIINVDNEDGYYKYKVIDKFVVEPDNLSVLNQPKDKVILTLITCHPVVVATHRLIIITELM